MKVSIVGTGYVGLVSGVCLASKGHEVICVEMKSDIVDLLNSGSPHIYEKGLKEILQNVIRSKKFVVTSDLNLALDNSELIIVAVGTPNNNGSIDLSQIEKVSKQIGSYIKNSSKYISIVLKSTVLPTTTDTFVSQIIQNVSGKSKNEFGLGMNPEFLREGDAIEDFLFPDRVVIGSEDEITRDRLSELYEIWNCDKIYVNSRTAEMIKYANNTILATIISLNNELSNVTKLIGDIKYADIINGISTDRRWCTVMPNETKILPQIISYFKPGVGFGGSCFPKDLRAINTFGKSIGLDMSITNSVIEVNNNQAFICMDYLEKKIGDFKYRNVLLLGLAFKEGTDDIRESTSIKLLSYLLDKNVEVYVHDPVALDNFRNFTQHKYLNIAESWESYIDKVEIIIIGTNWHDYKKLLEYDKEGKLRNKIIFDSKGLFDVDALLNCDYYTTGYSKDK